ncbi:fimbria/pilus outer membrane usher protein [Escherichia coli]|nr:fimbria/pilus outer membrane usher protein [Escherichia coli]
MYRTHRQHSLLSSGGVPSFIGGLVVFVSAAFNAQAETWFDPAFFKDDPSMVADLSRFEKGQKITPGVYRVDIVLNQTIVDTRNVNFVELTPEKGIAACLTTESLDAMGVNTDAFPAFKQLDKQACALLAEIIPDASVTFNVNKLRLEISVPQIAIKSNARGYVPPERWDEGINALLLGYSFSGANSIHSSADSDSGDSYFLNLNSGVNLGPWRLRNNSTWSRSSGQTAEWKNLISYLQRAVIPLKGELTVGDDYTAGDFFDSVSFRGVQLASDDNMLPDSLKGFAPVVRGIAKSNAQITIKQNGYTIYQTYVSPGAFEISDLYSTSSSGDLLVEIKEADGSVNSYSVPFSSVPSGKVENQSVKVAMRSVFKLFWRPEGLPGDPLEAYQQLRWTRNSQGVQLTNPTPYYINLIQVSVNGKALSNVGVVPPKSQRQTSWCQAIAPCHVAWRAINDYGGLSAKKEQNLP